MSQTTAPTPPQAPPRSITLIGLADVTLYLIAAASVGAFAGRWWWLLDLTSHFRLQYFALALFLGALYGIRRYKVQTGVAAGVALVNLIVLQPHLMTQGTATQRQGSIRARLLWWNIQAGNERKQEAIEWIEQSAADIVALGEVTPEWEQALESIHEAYPYRFVEARSDNFGIALYSRVPLFNSTLISPSAEGVPSIRSEINLQGRVVTLFITHPVPPMAKRSTTRRNRQLEWIAKQVAQASSPVLLGDLNTTPWNHAFRSLTELSGLQNSAPTWTGTWPAKILPLRIPLDHCLTGEGMKVRSKEIDSPMGSDHSPVQAQLAW